MAWKKVQVRTIPNANTAYEQMSDEVISYMKTNYHDTGKRTSFSVSSSDDDLVLTYTSIFRDEASKNEWLKQNVTANGLSSSKLIYDSNGAENRELSRRVEFRVKTNAEKRIAKILNQ